MTQTATNGETLLIRFTTGAGGSGIWDLDKFQLSGAAGGAKYTVMWRFMKGSIAGKTDVLWEPQSPPPLPSGWVPKKSQIPGAVVQGVLNNNTSQTAQTFDYQIQIFIGKNNWNSPVTQLILLPVDEQ